MPSRVKDLLAKKKLALGSFITEIPSPAVPEIFGLAGFDFVIADTEHSSFTLETVANLVRGGRLAGTDVFVRVRENNPSLITQALDTGSQGIVVPHCDTKEDALAAVRRAKYSPLGERGVFGASAAAKYGLVEDYFNKANQGTMVIVQIESEEAVENAGEISSVKGVDVVFVGPYDLSQTLGLIGEVNHPRVEKAIRKVLAAAKKFEKPAGILVVDLPGARKWIKEGVSFLVYSVEALIFRQSLEEIARNVRAR